MDPRKSSQNYSTSLEESVQRRFVRIEILDKDFVAVDSIEGRCLSGNITIDAESDIRRTGNIVLTIEGTKFKATAGSDIWLDKYVKIYVGTYKESKYFYIGDSIDWIDCGIYIIDAPTYFYDHTTNTLSLSLLDLMAKYTDKRSGYLEGVPVVLKEGELFKDALISILDLAGIKKYRITNLLNLKTLPFDLEFGQGTTIYDLLKGLLNLYPGFEMYFRTDGTFIFEKIPDGSDLSSYLDDDFWETITLNENVTLDFCNIKNSIEVYGRTHDPAYFAKSTAVGKNIIVLTCDEVTGGYSEGSIYGFVLKATTTYTDMQLKINDLPAYPLTLEDKNSPATIYKEPSENYYCVQFCKDHWRWLGHLQAYAKAEDGKSKSPFFVAGPLGRLRLPLFGGEYDNIFSDELAEERAKYELFLHSQLRDTITLTCIPVYKMNVNMLAVYTSKQSQEKNVYLTKNISMGLGVDETMSVTMMKVYVDYPRHPLT